MNRAAGRTGSGTRPRFRLTLFQKALAYLLFAVFFLAVIAYVSQGIEQKNVFYLMNDLMKQKKNLLDEKHRLELALLERQKFEGIERQLEDFALPIEPGPRLEIVFREDFDTDTAQMIRPGEPAGREDSWRSWLARMNEAHARMTSQSPPALGWRAPAAAEKPASTPGAEEKKT